MMASKVAEKLNGEDDEATTMISVAVELNGEDIEATTTTTTTISAIQQDVLMTHILPRLDGPSLASFSCTSSSLRLLVSSHQSLWTKICHSTWPSTASPILRRILDAYPGGGPRSFFVDAFLLPASTSATTTTALSTSTHVMMMKQRLLVSFVDIHYKKNNILSIVQEIDTTSDRFEETPFDIVYPDGNAVITIESNELTAKDLEEDLTLSWIVTDLYMQCRALNVSSRRAMSVKPEGRLSKGVVELKYSTVMVGDDDEGAVQCEITLKCLVEEEQPGHNIVNGGRGDVMKVMVRMLFVRLKMMDIEGNTFEGKEGLVILSGAMSLHSGGGGEKKKRRVGMEEGRKISREFIRRKRRKEIVGLFALLSCFLLYFLVMISGFILTLLVSWRYNSGFMGLHIVSGGTHQHNISTLFDS